MKRAELLDRARQEAAKRMDAALGRLGYRFSGRELGSAGSQVRRFFFAAQSLPSVLALLRERLPQQVERIVREANGCCDHRFDLLGYRDLDYGREIEWHCDLVHGKRAPRVPFYQLRYLDFESVGDVKITWELNRHQHFVTLAKAYRLTGEERFSDEIFRQWRHWLAENPYPLGVNWASSLEVAFRSLSWLWTYFLLEGAAEAIQDFRPQLFEALALSARHIERYLSTYFSPNTHLLGEGVALFFIGTLCPQLRSAARWKRLGWSIILSEADRQVRDDGMHFEQSAYYHVYALDFFLHSRILASLNGIQVPATLDKTIAKMLDVLCALGRSGFPPRLGDDDGGRVFDARRNTIECLLDPLATGAIVLGRGDLKSIPAELPEEALWLLGQAGVAEWDRLATRPPSADSIALTDSGIYCMTGTDLTDQLVIDAGPRKALRPGHWHAGALGISLSGNGKELLVDSGTCAYVDGDELRNAFRGTCAHNTLCVDGRDQADADGPFGWAGVPNVRVAAWIPGKHFDFFAGSHDGYTRLEPGLVHQRWVFSMKSNFRLIRDRVAGQGLHQLEQHWHLGPGLTHAGGNTLAFHGGDGYGLTLVPLEGNEIGQTVLDGWWSPVYGVKERAPVARLRTVRAVPAELAVAMVATHGADQSAGTLRLIEPRHEASVRGYHYQGNVDDYVLCFADDGRRWELGSFASDAAFFCRHMGEDGSTLLVICNGSFLEIEGRRLITCARVVSRCEIVLRHSGTEVWSDPDGVAVSTSVTSVGA